MNNPLFPLQWLPAPIADTSLSLPPLAEQATIALQDSLPVANSYSSQSKCDAAFAHNTDPHISFLVLLFLLHFCQFPTSRSRGRCPAWDCLRSLLHLTSQYSLLQQHHFSSYQMLLHTASGILYPSTDPAGADIDPYLSFKAVTKD